MRSGALNVGLMKKDNYKHNARDVQRKDKRKNLPMSLNCDKRWLKMGQFRFRDDHSL